MSEKIPADIMEVANSLDYMRGGPTSLDIALAILAERKRCAAAYMHWARKMMEEVEGKE